MKHLTSRNVEAGADSARPTPWRLYVCLVVRRSYLLCKPMVGSLDWDKIER